MQPEVAFSVSAPSGGHGRCPLDSHPSGGASRQARGCSPHPWEPLAAGPRPRTPPPAPITKRPAPSGDEPLDLSEPEDWGEASPFESRQAPRTKADLLNEIRQRTDRLTGQREAEQRQIDPWSAQPPQRRGHGR